jgi:hypothetical protein
MGFKFYIALDYIVKTLALEFVWQFTGRISLFHETIESILRIGITVCRCFID